MIFEKTINKKTISNAVAMGLIATSLMPLVNTEERVLAEKNTDTEETNSNTNLVEVTCSKINVRTGPGTEYDVSSQLTRGEKVKYISTYNSQWYKVEINGNEYYISSLYTKLTDSTSTSNESYSSSTSSSDSVQTVGIVTTSVLNVRNGVGTNYSVKTKVKRDDVLGILQKYNNGWVKVKLSDTSIGYVSGKYISVKSGSSSDINISQNITTEDNTQSSSNQSIESVISIVKSQVGKPYVYGAAGPNSFDCSGLTYYAYKQAGIYLNRSSKAQASNGVYVSKDNLQPGDLVFFNSGTSTIRHVGIYVGDGQFIHSPSPGKSVKYENLYSSYYVKGYVTARRIIE